MGIHGSPTCEIEFDGATGWLVGGLNRGMRNMFTMMNSARWALPTKVLASPKLLTKVP